MDEDEQEDTFVLERETPEPNSDGTFSGPAVLEGMPGDLQEQLKALLKGIKKVEPQVISDKRKRDEVSQAALAQSVQTLESRYATSAVEDENLLNQGSLPERIRMAIEVRLGEKKVLQEAKALFQGNSSGLPADDLGGSTKKTKLSN